MILQVLGFWLRPGDHENPPKNSGLVPNILDKFLGLLEVVLNHEYISYKRMCLYVHTLCKLKYATNRYIYIYRDTHVFFQVSVHPYPHQGCKGIITLVFAIPWNIPRISENPNTCFTISEGHGDSIITGNTSWQIPLIWHGEYEKRTCFFLAFFATYFILGWHHLL